MITNPGPNAAGELYCPVCEKNFVSGERCPTDNVKLVRLSGTDPFLGRELDGRYTILEKLGAGGMGAVYRANQRSVGREVAVKVVGNLVAEPDAIKRFLREAKLAGKLDHPSAVQVLDFGQTEDGLFYLVMELIRGQTLDVMLERDGGVLPPERVVRIGVQICDALECAHALSIVHRDLKPANIMVLAHGRDLIKVLDFGLAKSLSPDQTSTTMTGAGAMLGTPAFMPPELATGQRCDGRADLYSLGCILYLLGSGRLPFESDSIHELIAMHGMEPAPIMPGVPVGLAQVVDRLLAKEPGDRFQTAAETRDALEDCLDPTRSTVNGSRTSYPSLTPPIATPMPINVPVAAAVASTVRPAPKPKRRGWLWFVLAGALAGGGAAAVFVMNDRAAESKTTGSSEATEPVGGSKLPTEAKPSTDSKQPTDEAKPNTDSKQPTDEAKPKTDSDPDSKQATDTNIDKSPTEAKQTGSAAKPDDRGGAKPDKHEVASPPVRPIPTHLKPHSVKTVKPPVKDSPPTPAPPTTAPPTPTPPTPTPPTKPDEPKLPF